MRLGTIFYNDFELLDAMARWKCLVRLATKLSW